MIPEPASTASWRRCLAAPRLARKRKHHPIKHHVRKVTHVVTILKLRQILRKMLPADMDMRAVDPALERRPEALEAVDGRAAGADILTRAVVHRQMSVPAQPQPVVALEFIGMDMPARQHVGVDNGLEGGGTDIRDNLRHYLTAALQHANDDCFAGSAAPALAAPADTADIGFVNLNGREVA